MEDLWPALAIVVIVVFVFYVLAQHWQKVLRQQAWTIRRLFQRVQNLEEMANPEFRRRIGEAAPVPLERVFTFSFRLSDRFWHDALRASEGDQKFVRDFGIFVGSVKLECWRSHTVATITEVLPDRTTTGWQTRTLDFYSDPARTSDTLTLWELSLSRPGFSDERPPSLELVLRRNSIELCAHRTQPAGASSDNGHHAASSPDDVVFFRVPLDTAPLAEFRSHDPAGDGNNGNGSYGTNGMNGMSANGNSWQAFYSHRDERLGVEWQLRLRDLTKKSEWERWGILDSEVIPFTTEEK
jgi:hypothetical protein